MCFSEAISLYLYTEMVTNDSKYKIILLRCLNDKSFLHCLIQELSTFKDLSLAAPKCTFTTKSFSALWMKNKTLSDTCTQIVLFIKAPKIKWSRIELYTTMCRLFIKKYHR